MGRRAWGNPVRVEGFPPAKRLTHSYSTPASLGTQPWPSAKGFSMRTPFCLGQYVGESQGEGARCDFREGLWNFPSGSLIFLAAQTRSARSYTSQEVVINLTIALLGALHNLTTAPLGLALWSPLGN